MPKKTRKEQNDTSPSTNKTRRKLKVIRPIIQETQPQPQPIVDTIVNALSALNPFRNAPVEVEPIKWQEHDALTGPVPVPLTF